MMKSILFTVLIASVTTCYGQISPSNIGQTQPKEAQKQVQQLEKKQSDSKTKSQPTKVVVVTKKAAPPPAKVIVVKAPAKKVVITKRTTFVKKGKPTIKKENPKVKVLHHHHHHYHQVPPEYREGQARVYERPVVRHYRRIEPRIVAYPPIALISPQLRFVIR